MPSVRELEHILALHEILNNTTTGEIRVIFRTKDHNFVVVKFFDAVQLEDATFKWFRGMYKKVRRHWRTLTPLDSDTFDVANITARAYAVIAEGILSVTDRTQ